MRHAEYVAREMGEGAYFAREEGFAVSLFSVIVWRFFDIDPVIVLFLPTHT